MNPVGRIAGALLGVFLGAAAFAHSVSAVVGQVSIVRADRSFPAQVGSSVRPGDEIVSEESSEALIRFDDGARLALRPSSRTVFKALPRYSAGAKRSRERVIRIVAGRSRYVSAGNRKPQNVVFETNTATIGIRGTDIEIAVSDVPVDTDPPGTFLKVSRGEAFIRAVDGTEVDVRAGEVAFGGEPELVARGGGGRRRPAARPAVSRAGELFGPARLDDRLK